MHTELRQTLSDCARGAAEGTLQFPEIVQRLAERGVERYHADYSRGETTYYLTAGESEVVINRHLALPIAAEFSPAGVETAVRKSQRNEHTYADFVRETMASGCVGYFVQITGRRVLYFGRNGEVHEERFPIRDA